MFTSIRGFVCLCVVAISAGAQTPQLSKEYIRLGGRIIAIERNTSSMTGTTTHTLMIVAWGSGSQSTYVQSTITVHN